MTLIRPQSAWLFLDRVDGGIQDSIGSLTNGGTLNVTLTEGTYRLSFGVDVEGQPFSGQFLTVVPAPGAIALLGAAGLIGSRRRR